MSHRWDTIGFLKRLFQTTNDYNPSNVDKGRGDVCTLIAGDWINNGELIPL